jgi:Na+-driven multidrug efflux pump
MAMPFLGGWLVRLPLGYLLGYVWGFGLMGVWWTMLIDWCIRGSLTALKFRYMKFRLADMVHPPPSPVPVVATREVGG